MILATLVVVFALLVLLGVPIAFSMGGAAIAAIVIGQSVPMVLIPHRMVVSDESFVLLAIPLYLFAGSLMSASGMARRLVHLGRALVGHIRGGLGIGLMISSILFSGISGAKIAEVAAITYTSMDSMAESGYPRNYTAAVILASSAIAELVPPATLMIVLAAISNTSLIALFLAGFLPAAALALILAAFLSLQARQRDLPRIPRASWTEVGAAVRDSALAAVLPVLIFGGMYLGIATPTEIGAVAVLYAVAVGVFVYRELTWREVWRLAIHTGVQSGAILLLIALGSVFSYSLAVEQAPAMVRSHVLAISRAPWFFLAATAILMMTIGSVLEGIPAAIVFVPIFLPVAKQLGIDAIHFLIIVVISVGVALALPPAGVALAVCCDIAKLEMERVVGPLMPLLLAVVAGILVLILLPWIVTLVPSHLHPSLPR